ncbi:MAG: hypothetical protein Q8O91_10610 [Candidatus Aminicenantes bacterium]|nr:hypothetical protein [Candidatus Aminicenantes bacterium]
MSRTNFRLSSRAAPAFSFALVAGLLGRLNPFRPKIEAACTDCLACRQFCRYDALTPEDIARRRPGISCPKPPPPTQS